MASKPEGRPEDQGTRPANTPVEQQERDPKQVAKTRHDRIAISGPGASDFLTASGGIDFPESNTSKGMGQTRDEGPLADARRLTPRVAEDEDEGGPKS
jgi:hypothetical protein